MTASQAYAELKIDSVYPTMGIKGKDLSVTIKGSGFDQNTKISVALDSGNNKAILGSIFTGKVAWGTDGSTTIVAVSDSIAYVGGYCGFKVIDVSNPLNPKIIGSLDKDKLGTPTNIILSDSKTYAYISTEDFDNVTYTSTYYLKVVNVSDPKNPYIVGKINLNGFNYIYELRSWT